MTVEEAVSSLLMAEGVDIQATGQLPTKVLHTKVAGATLSNQWCHISGLEGINSNIMDSTMLHSTIQHSILHLMDISSTELLTFSMNKLERKAEMGNYLI